MILGVGHQTAKRLQALGLVSVKDLQVFPLSDLVREFGGPSAQRLKNLSLGVDDSPVTPTGAPQVGLDPPEITSIYLNWRSVLSSATVIKNL